MSDTPRTDAVELGPQCPHADSREADAYDFAHTLERELSTALAIIAARDSRIAELHVINERLHDDNGSWRKDYKQMEAWRDEARAQLREHIAESAAGAIKQVLEWAEVTTDRDALKAEVERLRAEGDRLQGAHTRAVNWLKETAADRDRLQAENEQIHKLVAAQQDALAKLIKLAEVWTPEFTSEIHRARLAWNDAELAKGAK